MSITFQLGDYITIAKRLGQGTFSLRGRGKEEVPVSVIYNSCSIVRNVRLGINEF